tara:strand:- start:648 stop:980 length:333 start_codon:yes stop_codon:yes gene_type:complete
MINLKSAVFYSKKYRELDGVLNEFRDNHDTYNRDHQLKFGKILEGKDLVKINYDERVAFYYSYYHEDFIFYGYIDPTSIIPMSTFLIDAIMDELYFLSRAAEFRDSKENA